MPSTLVAPRTTARTDLHSLSISPHSAPSQLDQFLRGPFISLFISLTLSVSTRPLDVFIHISLLHDILKTNHKSCT